MKLWEQCNRIEQSVLESDARLGPMVSESESRIIRLRENSSKLYRLSAWIWVRIQSLFMVVLRRHMNPGVERET